MSINEENPLIPRSPLHDSFLCSSIALFTVYIYSFAFASPFSLLFIDYFSMKLSDKLSIIAISKLYWHLEASECEERGQLMAMLLIPSRPRRNTLRDGWRRKSSGVRPLFQMSPMLVSWTLDGMLGEDSQAPEDRPSTKKTQKRQKELSTYPFAGTSLCCNNHKKCNFWDPLSYKLYISFLFSSFSSLPKLLKSKNLGNYQNQRISLSFREIAFTHLLLF